MFNKDEDIELKNITAKYIDQNKTLFISWKPVLNAIGLNDDIDDTSFTYTVKYKVINNNIFYKITRHFIVQI